MYADAEMLVMVVAYVGDTCALTLKERDLEGFRGTSSQRTIWLATVAPSREGLEVFLRPGETPIKGIASQGRRIFSMRCRVVGIEH